MLYHFLVPLAKDHILFNVLRERDEEVVKHPPSSLPGQARNERVHDPFQAHPDRKSTRLNSSHLVISYAVFCLKKKKKNIEYNEWLSKDRLTPTNTQPA